MRGKSTKLSRCINNDFCINIDDFRSNGNIKHIIISLQKVKSQLLFLGQR